MRMVSPPVLFFAICDRVAAIVSGGGAGNILL